jgi:hypothetical protein
MPFSFADLDLRTDLPEVPTSAPVVSLAAPCPGERAAAVHGLAKALGFEATGTVEVPHGHLVGCSTGQVEVFSASGAVRARNTDRLAGYPDERRPWADVEREETRDGVGYRLGGRTSDLLARTSLRLLDSIGLAAGHATLAVTLGQWARLDEKGTELESGPGRATVQLGYEAEGLRLIGPGAKTNLHFDPEEGGEGGLLARFFHVHRAPEGVTDVRTMSVEEALEPLFVETWSGLRVDPRSVRMAITSATLGLLALPADVPQRFAAPALAVEGRLEGVVAGDKREMELRFGQYLPLVHPKVLADAGFASAGRIVPGQVVSRRGKGR